MEDALTHIKAVLRTTPQRWHNLAQTVPEDLLRRKPLPGEWSALECLHHLVELDRLVFPVRAKALLAGGNIPAYDPDRDGKPLGNTSPAEMAAAFEALRIENLKLLDTLSPADFECSGIHSELGRVTLGNLLHEWAGHDLMHVVQAEQALMQPFIDGCGPWQVYFTKHKAL